MQHQPHTVDTVVCCKICSLVQRQGALTPGTLAECVRCGARLGEHKPNSLSRTAAFTLAALALYVPANIFPILRMDLYGVYSENTVWEGCKTLFERGEILVATARLGSRGRRPTRTWLYRAIDLVGPWAMLDVFLLAILVSLVKLGELATVIPGPGLFAFSAVVVLTILASSSFDPRLIWAGPDEEP